ncbi:hypothetical protein BDV19DRAFT_373078 [Aspergillus venezuelensis]
MFYSSLPLVFPSAPGLRALLHTSCTAYCQFAPCFFFSFSCARPLDLFLLPFYFFLLAFFYHHP